MSKDLRVAVQNGLSPRDWRDIHALWLRYLPSRTTLSPGIAPTDIVADYILLINQASIFGAMKGDQRATPLPVQVPGLRGIILDESLFQFHKAAHILSCSEKLVYLGRQTWPLTQAYQSAFFSVMGIFGLLGISLTDYKVGSGTKTPKSACLIVDVWPKSSMLRLSSGTYGTLADDAQLMCVDRIGHLQRWWLLQYLVTNVRNLPWPSHFVTALTSLNEYDFEHQRNTLQYGSNTWFFGDLHSDLHSTSGFGHLDTTTSGFLSYSSAMQACDFTVRVAVILMRMAILLLEDISTGTHLLDGDLTLLKTNLTDVTRHPIYGQCLLI